MRIEKILLTTNQVFKIKKFRSGTHCNAERSELLFKMKLLYTATTEYEIFGMRILNLLVENFPQTFFVGGMPRDLLLGRQVEDMDIATVASPKEVTKILQTNGIKPNLNNSEFGVVSAVQGNHVVEIATFRTDIYRTNRYPKVKFVTTAEEDALRRDFTINALYFQPHTQIVQDFFSGIEDLKTHSIKFIGEPGVRIQEDPLRILRALRFALVLDCTLEANTYAGIENNFPSVIKISESRKKTELEKISDKKNKIILEKVINKPDDLDKYFKKS